MSALALFAVLPWPERLFVRARLFSAPLAELARRAPAGKLADLGCGHGALAALLAWQRPDREVFGVDVDPRKVAWALASVGRLPNARFALGSAADLEPNAFDAVLVADVLYLLPMHAWPAFFANCRRALKPGGLLLLKEAEADGSWRALKARAQEEVMVRLLRRTSSSGAIGLVPRAETAALLEAAGFEIKEIASLARGYTTPHLLFVGKCV